jgi:hypothetical protein
MVVKSDNWFASVYSLLSVDTANKDVESISMAVLILNLLDWI